MNTEIAQRDPESVLPPDLAMYAKVISDAAANPAVDVEKLERLLNMQERILSKKAEIAFNAAFAEMQSEMPEITQHGEIKVSGQVRSKYAKFEDINEAVKPVLQKHGFAITFKTHTEKDSVTVTGILMHRDGHRESTDMMLEADTSGSKNGVQSIGSSVSYAKRYVLSALLNITTRGEDDNGARGKTEYITEEQVIELKRLATETKSSIPKLCKYYKIDKIENLPASLYESTVTAFKKRGSQEAETPAPERSQLQAAPAGQAIDKPTIKVITSKMELGALSIGDFKKRFGLSKLEEIDCKDIPTVLAWIIDPQNA